MHLSFDVGEPGQMTEIAPFLARSRFFLDSSFSVVFVITDPVTFAYPAKRKEKKTVELTMETRFFLYGYRYYISGLRVFFGVPSSLLYVLDCLVNCFLE